MSHDGSISRDDVAPFWNTWRNIWIRDVFCYRIPAPLVRGGGEHAPNPAYTMFIWCRESQPKHVSYAVCGAKRALATGLYLEAVLLEWRALWLWCGGQGVMRA